MRCKRVKKLVPEYTEGLLSSRREARVRSHLATCEACSEAADRDRLVTDALSTWPDLPLPEDALHHLETRIAFLPPPAPAVRAGVVRSMVLPYVAGVATAAAILLLARPLLAPGTPAPVSSPVEGTRPVAEVPEPPAPLPGERTLQFVDGAGRLMEVPWDAKVEAWLRENLESGQYRDFRSRFSPRTVDYEVK